MKSTDKNILHSFGVLRVVRDGSSPLIALLATRLLSQWMLRSV